MDTTSSDPVLRDINFDPNLVNAVPDVPQSNDPQSSWGGLDDLGSSVSNVASNILTSYGNLVAAQVNKTALLTATGKVGRSNTNAPTSNPNMWKYAVGIGVAALALVAVIKAVR
jgi:hypothetical protein